MEHPKARDDAYAVAVASAFGTVGTRISGSGGEVADAGSIPTFKKGNAPHQSRLRRRVMAGE